MTSTMQNSKREVQHPHISLIAAMSENRVIGRGNQLPWHMPADLKHFKELTSGHTVIMGRRTFESINSKPLPKRRNIVITRQMNYSPDGVTVAHDFDESMRVAAQASSLDEVFVLGGAEIFKLALPLANRIYLTVIHACIEGDTFFPQIDPHRWKLVSDDRHQPDEKNRHPFSFQLYEAIH
jgi:dihydrofolate reductase